MRKLSFSLAILALGASSCTKNDPATQPTPLPNSYSFENVDHSGQDARLDMLSEVTSYIEEGDAGQPVNEARLMAMFTNQGYTWQQADLNNSTKQIANKVAEEADELSAWISALDSISQNPGVGSNGSAGLVASKDGSRQYLLDAKGYHLAELIEKGTMGALSYYQATSVYLGEAKMQVDNETVEAGKGTAMQHHWDEAFGYWGVPHNFGSEDFTYDNDAAYHRFWAKYSNAVNEELGSNSKLMTAFIKGRNAINRAEYDVRDAAISEVRHEWEMISAAMAIHYLNAARSQFSDDALRNHALSEAVAFIWNLQFNPDQELSDSEIDNLLTQYFDNLYEISISDINIVRDLLADRYGLKAEKENL